jgi:glycolate oxidase FAD binding subunit
VIVADIPGGQPVYDWGGGLIWCRSDDGDAIRAAVAAHGGGHATLIRASEEMRRTANVFEPQPVPLAALSARVKESFDPRHILNPGRMYEGV